MRRREMMKINGGKCHQCAPRDWRSTPNVTGDYDLDMTILHRQNKDLPHRLELYTRKSGKTYGMVTGYSGYSNMHGDT